MTDRGYRSVEVGVTNDTRGNLIVSALATVLLGGAAAALAQPAQPKPYQAAFEELHPTAVAHLGKTADWVLATTDAVWVGSTGPFAVHRIDPRTGLETARVELPGEPCAGLAAGFGSLWVPLCGHPNALARIDLKTNTLAQVLAIGPAASEGGIAAGGDSVWMVTDKAGELSRINPLTGQVRQRITLPRGSYNPLYADGVVWVSGHDTGVITAVDAASGKVLSGVAVGPEPRFLTKGGGAIWVLNQGDGSVVRIDARTRRVTGRIQAGLKGHGGDIAWGAGQVWPTLDGIPLTAIDGRNGRIRRQWVGIGGDSLTYAFGAIWLTHYKVGTVARYPAAALKGR